MILDDLLRSAKNNVSKVVAIPAFVSSVQFLILLVQAASDGVIDDNELHQLMTAGSGINLIVLLLVYAILKLKNEK